MSPGPKRRFKPERQLFPACYWRGAFPDTLQQLLLRARCGRPWLETQRQRHGKTLTLVQKGFGLFTEPAAPFLKPHHFFRLKGADHIKAREMLECFVSHE